jgi:hypothetical protein
MTGPERWTIGFAICAGVFAVHASLISAGNLEYEPRPREPEMTIESGCCWCWRWSECDLFPRPMRESRKEWELRKLLCGVVDLTIEVGHVLGFLPAAPVSCWSDDGVCFDEELFGAQVRAPIRVRAPFATDVSLRL